jgi:hypothetical protein
MATSRKKNKVRVLFSGVIALCPGTPKSTASGGGYSTAGPLYALMPATQEQTLAGGKMHAHTPVIFTKLSASGGRSPDETYQGFHIWNLGRERVQFVVDGQTTGTLHYKHDPTSAVHTSPKPMTSVVDDSKVAPHVRDISPSRSVLLKNVLDTRPPQVVAAQVLIPFGTLSSGSHRKRDENGIPVVYRDVSTKSASPEKLAMPHVHLEFDVETSLRIDAQSLVDETPLPGITFTPGDGDIWVGNLDNVHELIDEIGGASFPDLVQCDMDFAFIYDLTEGTGDVRVPCSTALIKGGERKCYVAMVEAPTP